MSAFLKVALFLGVSLVVVAYLNGCTSAKNGWQYACSTPVGEVTITEETDNNISLKNGILSASRQGKSIRIPFSQCVALKDSQ